MDKNLGEGLGCAAVIVAFAFLILAIGAVKYLTTHCG
jgi:hypothetical protein